MWEKAEKTEMQGNATKRRKCRETFAKQRKPSHSHAFAGKEINKSSQAEAIRDVPIVPIPNLLPISILKKCRFRLFF